MNQPPKTAAKTGGRRVRLPASRAINIRAGTLAGLCVLILICLPVLIQGEVLYLKDGSAIKGNVVSFAGDTLTFDASFGTRMLVARSQIARLVFDDSFAGQAKPDRQGGEEGESAKGFLSVNFKDKQVSSKVVATRKNEAYMTEANFVVQLMVVDGDTVFAHVDSTTDKTIFKGHDRHLKNNAELVDMEVPLAAGLHHCVVIVASRGMGDESVEFETAPLDMIINLDNIQIHSDRTTRLILGIKKGRFRLGKADFYRVQ